MNRSTRRIHLQSSSDKIKMRLASFFERIKGNNIISKSRVFHSVKAAHINDCSKNELAQILLTGGMRNK